MDNEKMENVGVDVKGALDRFMGNENLYEKFMIKFLDDQNYQNLVKNINAGNWQDAFICAHTLKGLGANLGMQNLYRYLSPMVEILRKGEVEDSEMVSLKENMEHLTEEYEKTVALIREIEK